MISLLRGSSSCIAATGRRHTAAATSPALRSLGTAPSSHCPSCAAPLPTALPACPQCFHIAPLSRDVSYHALFGIDSLENPFQVDTILLRRRFLQAQRLCHPDNWSGKDAQPVAAAISSHLNKAYRTLLSPLERAQYILRQRGLETAETAGLNDHELIMEVLDVRQELEDAQSPSVVETIRLANQVKIDETTQKLASFIGEKAWSDAQREAVRLKYWKGIEDAAKAWPDTVSNH